MANGIEKSGKRSLVKDRVQGVGRALSAMVMPNLAAFIAWGLITALFISTGWLPNEALATLVDPMLKYLLPVLIGYTGGKLVGGQRGAVVGAIATIGVVVGADIPMFMGAMIAGPVGGIAIKKFDEAFDGKIKQGFEMLVNNFSAGIIGGILAVIFFLLIAPVCEGITWALGEGVAVLVNNHLLPLAAILVEPAKVLFLNNAINHGVFTPLGAEQVAEAGKSLFYMVESNPGPGLGLLVAYCLAGKGNARSSAPGAIIIQFFGGIHEIYFPYILMNPVVIVGPIAGNIVSIFILSTFGGGLIAPASPGSIFAELMMTPKGGYVVNILAIVLAAAVSLFVSFIMLKIFGKDGDIDAEAEKSKQRKAESKGIAQPKEPSDIDLAKVKKVVFACDAGMGSSAMGATMLKKKFAAAGLTDIEVVHSPVSEIPSDVEIIVTQTNLEGRARASNATAKIVTISNFMGAPEYDSLANEISEARK